VVLLWRRINFTYFQGGQLRCIRKSIHKQKQGIAMTRPSDIKKIMSKVSTPCPIAAKQSKNLASVSHSLVRYPTLELNRDT
jgi:hypothetical protein